MISNSKQVEFLFNEDIWIVGITVSYVRTKTALTWDKLVGEKTNELLRHFKVKPPSVPFSELVAAGHEKLRYQAGVVKQRHLVYAEPFWFMPDSRWQDFTADFKRLEEQAEFIKSDMIQSIDVIEAQYNEKVDLLIEHIWQETSNYTSRDELDAIEQMLKSRVITVDEIRRDISVQMLPPIRIKSFVEQAQQNAKLKVATAEAERAKLINAATASAVERIRKSAEQAVQEAREQAIASIGECLDLLSSVAGGNMTVSNQQRINARLEKLSLLVNFADNDLSSLIGEVQSTSRDATMKRITDLRSKLQSYTQGKTTGSIARTIKF